jgi:hypothetical protein
VKKLTIQDPAFLAAAAAGGSPYTALPTDYAGLLRWYKAEDYSDDGLNDNDPVVNDMPDHSTVGDDAVPDGTYPPHFRLAYMPTGKDCVQCPDGWHHTVIVVWKPTADAILTSSTSGNYQIRNTTGGVPNSWTPYSYHNSVPALTNNTSDNAQVWHYHSWTRDGSTGVPSFGYNKSYVGEATSSTNTTAMKFNTVGLYNGGPGAFYLAEICIYNAVLSSADIDTLYDGYFNIKYLGDLGSV